MHIAIIGTGKVGQTLAYTLLRESYIKELSLSDIIPNLTNALSEELRHAMGDTLIPIKINAYEKNNKIKNADIIIICAGMPRNPQMKDRKDLCNANAKIIKSIAKEITIKNKLAKYIIVTNPVDAMATLFTKYSKAKFVVSTGTALDTLRFRSEIAKALNVPINKIEGFVAGEHGQSAVFLWSSVKINQMPLEKYLQQKNVKLNKKEVEEAVKKISMMIIQEMGGTRFGPAAAFRQIISSIAENKKELLSVATLSNDPEFGKSVHLSIPLIVGKELGKNIKGNLTQEEKININIAASSIWETYQEALESTCR